MEGVVKPNVSPNKKKDGDGDDGEAAADGDTDKKKGKGDEVRLMGELIQIHHLSPLLADFRHIYSRQ